MDDQNIGVADFVLLEQLTDEHMINNLKMRFDKKRIYTSIGDVIVSLNPYQKLDIYDSKAIALYRGKQIYELPPHM
jgi:myosin-1